MEFWTQFDARWGAIIALHPNIAPEDADKVRAAVARRVPRTEHERLLLTRAVAQRDVIAAMAVDDGGWALMDAAMTLVQLMPDPKPRAATGPAPRLLQLRETSPAKEPA